jgi:CRISPR-associated protein Cas2
MTRSFTLSNGFYIVCYDIPDNNRRRRIANELENYGMRVQGSVFECHLDLNELEQLKRSLGSLIDDAQDHIRYYSLCPKDKEKIIVDGRGQVSVDTDYHLL